MRAKRTTADRRRAVRRGRHSEAIAVWWLRLKGYRILARDLRSAVGEIDILALRGRTVAAVEVKARADTAAAAAAISERQRERIIRAVRLYLARRPGFAGHDLRFDVMLVAPGHWPRHVIDAWQQRSNRAT